MKALNNFKTFVICIALLIPAIARAKVDYHALKDQCYDEGGPSCARLEKMCDKKDINGCFFLAEVRAKQHDTEETTRLLRLGCRYGDAEACKILKDREENQAKAVAAAQEAQRQADEQVEQIHEMQKRAYIMELQQQNSDQMNNTLQNLSNAWSRYPHQ